MAKTDNGQADDPQNPATASPTPEAKSQEAGSQNDYALANALPAWDLVPATQFVRRR